jgi:hypothetical protein
MIMTAMYQVAGDEGESEPRETVVSRPVTASVLQGDGWQVRVDATGEVAVTQPDAPLTGPDEIFVELAARWKTETRNLSSMHDIVLNPAYAQIIGLGVPAIPLILRELRDDPDAWFYALTAITREDPAAGMTKFDDAVQAWVDWGRERRYI